MSKLQLILVRGNKMNGVILKGIGGFYYVEVDGKIIECKARGRFRNENIKPFVGDNVSVDVEKGYILEINERKNNLLRPSVANVGRAIIVLSALNPPVNLNLLDKFIISFYKNNIDVAVCINKCDLIDIGDYKNINDSYSKIGIPVFFTSTKQIDTVEELKSYISNINGITIFSGQSGVGKSSLLNAILPSLSLETGNISEKLKRGKHTTRHVELFHMGRGYLADTPGFSSIDISSIDYKEIKNYYMDFVKFEDDCSFFGCSHINEPESKCAVKRAVSDGKIDLGHYERYVEIYKELKLTQE